MVKVIHFMPSINVTSGIAQMVMNYYRVIDRRQIQFNFIYFIDKSKGNFEEEINSLGGNSIKVSTPINYIKFRNEVILYLKKNKDTKIIFHNHQINFQIFLQPILLKLGIKNCIVHNHMTKYSDKLISSIRNSILCYPIKFINLKYYACSYDAGVFMFGKKNMNNGSVTIMNNGINCEKYKFNKQMRIDKRREFKLEKNFVIGHIGHFNKVKNHKFIIEVFEKIYNKNKSARLLLIGNGPLRNEVEKQIEEKNLTTKVIILENRTDVAELMSAMDSFIFPSLFEGLGIAAIEAQSTGLPVFISDKVPVDVSVINCNILSLNDSSDKWADSINGIQISYEERIKANEYIKNSKFNILKSKDRYLEEIKKL